MKRTLLLVSGPRRHPRPERMRAGSGAVAAGPRALRLRHLRGTERVGDAHVGGDLAVQLRVGIYIGGANRGARSRTSTPGLGEHGHLLRLEAAADLGPGPRRRARRWVPPPRSAAIPRRRWPWARPRRTRPPNVAHGARVHLAGCPVYYDMEAYPRGGACSVSVQAFVIGWVRRTEQPRGHRAGFTAASARASSTWQPSTASPYFQQLNAVWIAAWNDTPEHLRVRAAVPRSSMLVRARPRSVCTSTTGGYNEGYGGVTLSTIDSNAVATAPRGPDPVFSLPCRGRGDVAQLARAPALQAGGRGFESHRLHQGVRRVCAGVGPFSGPP